MKWLTIGLIYVLSLTAYVAGAVGNLSPAYVIGWDHVFTCFFFVAIPFVLGWLSGMEM